MRFKAIINRMPFILAFLSACLFYLIFIHRTDFIYHGRTFFSLIDDAMISMRYAEHFAQRHGLVWNIGGEAVQGYTNLLWTLYMSLMHDIFGRGASLAVMYSGAVILVLNALYIRNTAMLLIRDKWAAYCAMLYALFLYPLVFWTLRGMETGLVSLLVSMAVYYALSGRVYLTGLLLFVLPVVRMDCILPAVLIGLYGFFTFKKRSLTGLFCAASGLIAVLVFQKYYYGGYLPNTYLLKVAGVSQAEKTALGLKVFLSNALPFIIVPLVASAVYFKKNGAYLLLLLIFAAQAVYSVLVGGDYAEQNTSTVNRFIVIGMPMLAVLFLGLFKRVMLIPAFLVLIVPFAGDFSGWVSGNAPLLDSDIHRARIGMMINDYTHKDAVIAVHGAGNIGYFSKRTAVDILGKSDSYIANEAPKAPFRPGHNKWDYEYVLRQRPDIIADEWGKSGEFFLYHPEYIRLKNGIRYRMSSEKIKDVKALGGER